MSERERDAEMTRWAIRVERAEEVARRTGWCEHGSYTVNIVAALIIAMAILEAKSR